MTVPVHTPRPPAPGGMLEEHLEHLAYRNLRSSTIAQRGYVLQRFRRHIGLDVSPLAVTQDHIVSYLESLRSPEQRASELSHIRGFYRWAVGEKYLEVDPTARIQRPKLARRLPRPMPDVDKERALAGAPERVQPMLYLAAYAGLRACEIANLRGEDVLLESNPPILLILVGKGGSGSTVPICEVLAERLAAMPRSGWLFPRKDGKPGPVPPHLVSHHCNRYLHSIGISHTLHTLRHWFCTKAYQASGGDLRATQELARHRTPVSTAIYTFVDPKNLATIVGNLPSPD